MQSQSPTLRIRQRYSDMEAVFNSLPQGVMIFGRDGTIRMNRAAAKLHGFHAGKPSQEVYDREFALQYPDGRPVPTEAWPASRALRGEVVTDLELHCHSRYTHHAWHGLYTATPIADENGEIPSAVVVINKIPERNPADAVLVRLASMVESSAAPMVGLTPDGVVENWNRAAESLFGYSAAEIVGQPVAILGACQGRHEKVDAIRCVRSGGVVHNLETVRIAKDGRKIPVLLTIAPINNQAGAVVGMSATVIDITERKKVEAALKEADRRKDDFLAVLAHELRNPLAPIRNAVEILNLQAPRDTTAEVARNVIERQLQHLVRLVDDLLDVSRITRGKLELRRERVVLTSVMEQALESAMPHMHRSEHEVHVCWPSEPIYIHADAVRLTQVFSNLLNNACNYTQRGGHIWMTAALNHAEVMVTVKDNGRGIAAEDLLHVFDMFAQLCSPLERSHSGLGLGLSLAKRLVELHGGTIEVKSDGVGKGSEFIVRLPTVERKDASQTKTQKKRDVPERSANHRILVADDNTDSAQSLAILLRLRGNDVGIAYDGFEAVQKAQKYHPDAILLDIGMPKMNGYDACRAIREQPWGRKIPIVAVTGWGQEHDRSRSTEAGFDGHLVKPVDPERLLDLLYSLLR